MIAAIFAIGAIIYSAINFEWWETVLVIIIACVSASTANILVIALNIVVWGLYAIKRFSA